MFPQFCRSGPKKTRRGKEPPIKTAADKQIGTYDSRAGATKTFPGGEDSSCQLEHCNFCDYRACCQVTSFDKEIHDLKSLDSDYEVTENPAYGLSSKNYSAFRCKGSKDEACSDIKQNMEFSSNDAVQIKETNSVNNSLINTNIYSKEKSAASQQNVNCDDDKKLIKNSTGGYNKTESKVISTDQANERSKYDSHKPNVGLTWSILKHIQLSSDTSANCDNEKSESFEVGQSVSEVIPQHESTEQESEESSKQKRNLKDRSLPLSRLKSADTAVDRKAGQMDKAELLRQRPEQKTKSVPTANRTKVQDPPRKDVDPLSAMEKIKTEESIQEWLARINESTNSISEKSEINHKPWSLNKVTANDATTSKAKLLTETTHFLNQALQEALEISHNKPYSEPRYSPDYQDYHEDEFMDTVELLNNSSKSSPANIPMVVMQCSRLHSHIGSKPPFQQTSLPMGTLITALYQESDWLYVQTPHGVEGFIVAANCVPIGTMNDSPRTSCRPWEPCDFPIEINVKRNCDFGRQGAYIAAKLPTNGHKPFVSTVKMKTNFYSDRYFSHTFKSKDSIKTAKTVTDILRNSPETKVSNQ